jgi:hypothetical protein
MVWGSCPGDSVKDDGVVFEVTDDCGGAVRLQTEVEADDVPGAGYGGLGTVEGDTRLEVVDGGEAVFSFGPFIEEQSPVRGLGESATLFREPIDVHPRGRTGNLMNTPQRISLGVLKHFVGPVGRVTGGSEHHHSGLLGLCDCGGHGLPEAQGAGSGGPLGDLVDEHAAAPGAPMPKGRQRQGCRGWSRLGVQLEGSSGNVY